MKKIYLFLFVFICFFKSINGLTIDTKANGSSITNMNASNLTTGTVPSGRMTGSYTGITGVGILTTGTWNADIITVPYGGTGAATLNGYVKASGTSAFTGASTIPTSDLSGVINVSHGGTNASAASITAFNNITGYTAAGATGTTSANLVFSTSPTFITPTLGDATFTSLTSSSSSPATSGLLRSASTDTIIGIRDNGNSNNLTVAKDSSDVLIWNGSGLKLNRLTAASSGVTSYFNITPSSDTNLTASTEVPILNMASATRQWATGSLTTQRESIYNQPTYSFVGTSTLTDAATIGISGAPSAGTNATITNTHGLLVSAGSVTASANNSYGMSINAQTGAGTNYIAQLRGTSSSGKGVGIGLSNPSATLQITRDSASSGGSIPYLYVLSMADLAISAGNETPVFQINNAASRQWATGALTIQRDNLFNQGTMKFSGASTATDVATVGIAGSPIKGTNATITNSHGLLISAGASLAGATNGYGFTCNTPTGATNNYCAEFLGGNVGIGTATPAVPLEIKGSGAAVRLTESPSGNATYFQMDTTSETGGKLWRFGYTGAATFTKFSFLNQTDNVNGPVFDASGNVGIGTTTPAYSLQIGTDSAGKPGVGGLWTVVSDQRVKTDIMDIPNALSIICKLHVRQFHYKPEASKIFGIDPTELQYGFIAQEYESVFPKDVSIHGDLDLGSEIIKDVKEVNTGQTSALALKAIQELSQYVDDLRIRVSALELEIREFRDDSK